MTPPDGNSVFDEPHMRPEEPKSDPSEKTAAESEAPSGKDKIEHTVWGEPGLSRELAGATPEGASYGEWLKSNRERVSPFKTWMVTIGLALLAGPWAILGAFYGSGQSMFTILVTVVFGPLAEEMMKVAGVTYVVEKRPYLFKDPMQIAVAALAGGLAFAAIENLIYFNVYIKNPTAGIIQWRWTVCVAMHVGCSLVAGMGMTRVWRDAWKRMARPKLSKAYPYLVAAVLIHGGYNAFAVWYEMAGFEF